MDCSRRLEPRRKLRGVIDGDRCGGKRLASERVETTIQIIIAAVVDDTRAPAHGQRSVVARRSIRGRSMRLRPVFTHRQLGCAKDRSKYSMIFASSRLLSGFIFGGRETSIKIDSAS